MKFSTDLGRYGGKIEFIYDILGAMQDISILYTSVLKVISSDGPKILFQCFCPK